MGRTTLGWRSTGSSGPTATRRGRQWQAKRASSNRRPSNTRARPTVKRAEKAEPSTRARHVRRYCDAHDYRETHYSGDTALTRLEWEQWLQVNAGALDSICPPSPPCKHWVAHRSPPSAVPAAERVQAGEPPGPCLPPPPTALRVSGRPPSPSSLPCETRHTRYTYV